MVRGQTAAVGARQTTAQNRREFHHPPILKPRNYSVKKSLNAPQAVILPLVQKRRNIPSAVDHVENLYRVARGEIEDDVIAVTADRV